jgi:hypothetical protein
MAQENPEQHRSPGQVIRLPRFSLPFPSDISPFAAALTEQSESWAVDAGLVPGREAAARLRRNGIMNAGPRLVPGAPLNEARLVCDWTVFLIVIDDEFDDEGAELGARPDLARPAIEGVISAFRGQEHGQAGSFPRLAGISAAAADLGRRAAALSPDPGWLSRFGHHAEEHIWSKVTEAQQRASGTVLDVPGYVDMRRITSAAYAYADLAELAGQGPASGQVRESPAWKTMLDAVADIWLGIQDICSAAKEVAAGDAGLNLAAVMARSTGGSLQQGVDDAYQWVCRRSADFTAQRAQLTAIPRQAAPGSDRAAAITRYIDAVERLLGGHLTWNSQDNPRYTQVVPSA